MPNGVPAAHLVVGAGLSHASFSGAVLATIFFTIVSVQTAVRGVLEYDPEVRNTVTSKQNVEGTAK
jgi:hypothetical protein